MNKDTKNTLNSIGYFLFVAGAILSFTERLFIGIIMISFSILCMLPKRYEVIIERSRKDDNWNAYWIAKFIGLVICLIVLIIGLIAYVKNNLSIK